MTKTIEFNKYECVYILGSTVRTYRQYEDADAGHLESDKMITLQILASIIRQCYALTKEELEEEAQEDIEGLLAEAEKYIN